MIFFLCKRLRSKRDFGVLLLLFALAPFPTGPVHVDALRDDTLLGVESEDHDWGRRWQITAFCLTQLFLLYACAIGFAFVILLFYAVMRGTVRFCMLQFANAFCRKGPVNVMHAFAVVLAVFLFLLLDVLKATFLFSTRCVLLAKWYCSRKKHFISRYS